MVEVHSADMGHNCDRKNGLKRHYGSKPQQSAREFSLKWWETSLPCMENWRHIALGRAAKQRKAWSKLAWESRISVRERTSTMSASRRVHAPLPLHQKAMGISSKWAPSLFLIFLSPSEKNPVMRKEMGRGLWVKMAQHHTFHPAFIPHPWRGGVAGFPFTCLFSPGLNWAGMGGQLAIKKTEWKWSGLDRTDVVGKWRRRELTHWQEKGKKERGQVAQQLISVQKGKKESWSCQELKGCVLK